MEFSTLVKELQEPEASPKPLPEWRHAKVKWFDAKKGYGFLSAPGESRDIFIHSMVLETSGFPYRLNDTFKVKARWSELPDGRLRASEIKPLEKGE